MAMSSREARRKKIMERGADRLALITGQIQTLPPPSPSSSPAEAYPLPPPPQARHAHTSSSPPMLLSRQDHFRSRGMDQTLVAPIVESDEPSTTSPKHESDNGSPTNPAIETGNHTEPQLRKCETDVKNIRTPLLDFSSSEPPCPVSSTVPDCTFTAADTEPHVPVEQRIRRPKFFTSNQISSSITATENIRILCSITIAITVVLSHLSLPFVGSSIIKSIIAFRPLYLLFLTDITVVLARLLLVKQKKLVKAEEEARETHPEDDAGWAMGVGKSLEMGLLIYKAFNAAFMDFSVYAVVVICGLSLLQRSL